MKSFKTALMFAIVLIGVLTVACEDAQAWGKKSRRSTSASVSISPKKISDSLVQDLSCQRLSIDNIYRSIKPEAFSSNNHFPIQNWDFRSGLATLGACWGLSSAQRMFFYLARFGEASPLSNYQLLPPLLDMIRGEKLYASGYDADSSERVSSRKLTSYQVFSVEAPSLLEDYWHSQSLWAQMKYGYIQDLDGAAVFRKFREEVEARQVSHFYRLGNMKMAAGSGARSGRKNAEVAQLLRKNLDGKRLTLVNIRPSRTTQHVLVVKSYTIFQGIITFKVYDSNAPGQDWDLKYSISGRNFYAPDVVGRYTSGRNSYDLGVYVVDEDERDLLEDAMFNHYVKKCRSY